jgi:hypothetical protein
LSIFESPPIADSLAPTEAAECFGRSVYFRNLAAGRLL